MPAVAKTGLEQIVAAGRDLLEEGGVEAVTMHAVARRVGVQAPSLYKRVQNRRDLLAEVVSATMEDLIERAEAVRDDRDPRRSITDLMGELRRFAHDRPHGYALVFGASPGAPRPDQEALQRSLRPMLDATTALLGAEHALDGARFLTAWANGFISMELGGFLRMGGDIDGAWAWGLQHAVAVLDDGSRARTAGDGQAASAT